VNQEQGFCDDFGAQGPLGVDTDFVVVRDEPVAEYLVAGRRLVLRNPQGPENLVPIAEFGSSTVYEKTG